MEWENVFQEEDDELRAEEEEKEVDDSIPLNITDLAPFLQ